MTATVRYMSGFGNQFETEALPGALPAGRNSPQKCAYGLYAEQLSGTAFTLPRAANRRTWTYRIRPSVTHRPYESIGAGLIREPVDFLGLDVALYSGLTYAYLLIMMFPLY